MERDVYKRLDALQDRHWWFCARRDVVRQTLKRLIDPARRPRILEAGCGTGGNLRMLADLGDVQAFEPDEEARSMARAKGDFPITPGALPDTIPDYEDPFSLIVAFDVIEHVEHDLESLTALRGRLERGGRMVITVPAFPFLWSRHDEVNHHYRRYTRAHLVETLRKAGFEIDHVTYFNSLLFPLIAGVRIVKSLFGVKDDGDDRMPPGPVNSFLKSIFSAERHWVGRISMPFGVSLLAVARNPA